MIIWRNFQILMNEIQTNLFLFITFTIHPLPLSQLIIQVIITIREQTIIITVIIEI